MSRYSDSDPYLDPATGVLKNRLGITAEATLLRTNVQGVSQAVGWNRKELHAD